MARYKKQKKILSIIATLIFLLSVPVWALQTTGEEFTFVITSDQRDHASEPFHSQEYTLGGYQAIRETGQGDFMIVLGDMDPVQATDDLLEQVFGEEYIWYPVVGNHDIENPADLEYIRALNSRENPLPKVVNRGPAGCEETNYSFDWNGVHFVVFDVFYEASGQYLKYTPVDEKILAWLENDFKQNQGKRIFVFSHKPVYPFPDMDNVTQRHVAEVLDRFPENALELQRLFVRYGVTAYFSGHTHAASWAIVNGIWHINSGHLYGQEGDYTPKKLLNLLSESVAASGLVDTTAVRLFYEKDAKEIRKVVYLIDPVPGKDYKILTVKEGLERLQMFYRDCVADTRAVNNFSERFWNNLDWRKSTFLKITVRADSAELEIYRDSDFKGNYVLRHKLVLY